MARAESGGDGEEEVVSRTNLSIPRGGPIYTSNLMSPLTRVPIFESDILREIQSLEAELAADCSPSSTTDDDVSVDDIKIFTDEELVEMAIKEAFRDEQNNGGCSNPCGENLNAGTEYDVSEREGSQRTNHKGTPIKRTSRKGKKRKMDKHADDSYLVKVNELLKVKQKQDQDRAAAGLHSLSCKINEGVSSSSEKAEMLKSLRSTNSRTQLVKPSEIQDFVAVQLPEVVLCVEVYHNIRKYIKSQEFLVLGRQLLTEMRDKIYCVTDQVMQRAGQHDPSGYFLLEDVFYNDLRDPSAIDYSEPIFDWLRNSKDDALKKWETCIRGKLRKNQREVLGDIKISELPQFRCADMHKTRFCDLRFRLGAGYLYCHQVYLGQYMLLCLEYFDVVFIWSDRGRDIKEDCERRKKALILSLKIFFSLP
uniref:Uncharacterized protein MANES_08G015000 n=1 Tax=Rhizophora mucronata TaxID=61149 RepID=A0A2P2MAR0_RHIMU